MVNESSKLFARFAGEGSCFVIAEAGVNHDGELDRAIALVDAAADAGADAVKFQTFRAADLVTTDARKAGYQQETTGAGESQFEMLRRLELSEAAHRELFAHCERRGILFVSSPFDRLSADFLEDLDVAFFKLGSGELTNLPLVEHVARKGRPLVLSTGMAHLGEVEEAVRTVERTGNAHLALLHCVSSYPADPAETNLRAMDVMRSFGYPVGYSDHTLGIAVPIAAVARGARIIEKHITLDRTLPGPDHRASLEPDELRAMIEGLRMAEQALGDGRKRPAPSEKDTAEVARKSLVVAEALPAGTVLTREMLVIKRPGTGLPPRFLDFVVGRKLRRDVGRDHLLDAGDLV